MNKDESQKALLGLMVVFIVVGVAAVGVATNPTFDERARMEQELEEWKRQEWIQELLEQRRKELQDRIKYKQT